MSDPTERAAAPQLTVQLFGADVTEADVVEAGRATRELLRAIAGEMFGDPDAIEWALSRPVRLRRLRCPATNGGATRRLDQRRRARLLPRVPIWTGGR